jgi:hypothetical protein
MTPPQTLAALRAPARSAESVLTARWARVFVPTLSDLFFLAILVWLFMSSGAAGWQGLLVDGDAGWHIRTGQYILDHHSVPHRDLYSFSKPGAPWYAWEWGSDVVFGWLERVAGLKGVVLFTGVVLAGFATSLIRRMVWRGVHLFVAVGVALLSVGAASIHFLARPHIFTLLFLSIAVWMVECDREKQSNRIWLLVPLTIVWTNLHGGFLALIALLGLCAVGTALEAWSAKEAWGGLWWRRAARYLALGAACSVASLVNPYGYRLHTHMVAYLRSDWIRTVVQEFMSPSFRTENMLQFEALLMIGLIAAAGLVRRKSIVEAVWIVFFAHLALASVRHVPVYVTVVGPVVAYEVATWWKAWSRGAVKQSLPAIFNQLAADWAPAFRRTSIWPSAVVVGLALTGAAIHWPKDFPEIDFPTGIVHAHAAEILSARVLTTDQWADYLIYVDPRQKVFVDGRSDFYGPELGNPYLRLINGGPDWRDLVKKYDFNLVLLPKDLALVQLLETQPEWRITAQDDKRILLARTAPSVPSTGNFGAEPRF